ncbi:MAG: prepilin peptidase [Magnetococcales bacterium]|nr:prepilin peptidase [Magnetococcales bacterium]
MPDFYWIPLEQLPPHLISVLLFLFGAIVGSFLNVCIHRLPEHHSLLWPSSHCPACEQPIRWFDNIPLLSWLILRGRCRRCRATISPRYPLIELAGALLPLLVVHRFGLTADALLLTLLGWSFIVLLVIDLYHYILPDVITLPGIVAGLLAAWLVPRVSALPSLTDASLGLAIGGGLFWLFGWVFERLTGKVGLGFGDVKLLAMIGAWMGWQALPFTIFAAAVAGSVVGLSWILLLGRDRTLPIPFGPYLVLAAWSYLYWGADFYSWYFNAFIPG